MVNKIQGTILGILLFLFGLVATYYVWGYVTGFLNLIDNTLLKIIWIIGVLGVWGSNVVLVPYLLIIDGGVKWFNTLKGLLVFIIASICSLISYYIVPPIIETLNTITSFGDLTIVGNMTWFGLVLFWVLALIVYPLVIILKGGIQEKEEE